MSQQVAHIRLEADGGSRGNPGVAGSGTVLYDAASGEKLAALAYRVGHESNNVAEYFGLLTGLETALAFQPERVDIYLDSKLVVEQMSGRWKIKHPRMQELALRCRKVLQQIPNSSFTWVPRAKNKTADALSNIAMDACQHNPEPGFVAGYEPPQQEPAHEETAQEEAAQQESLIPEDDAAGAEQPMQVAADQDAAGQKAGSEQRRSPGNSQTKGAAEQPKQEMFAFATATAKARAGEDTQDPATTATTATAERTETSESAGAKPADWKGASTQATRLVLLRHGQTAHSAEKRYSGRSNPSLTALGREQVEAAAQFLEQAEPFDAIVASPLRRCQETASIVAQRQPELQAEIVTRKALIELDFGNWDGMTFSEAHAADPEFHTRWLQDPKLAAPGGEAVADVHRRVGEFRRWVCRTYPGQRVLVVSHVTPIKSLLAQALQVPITVAMQLHLDLASTSVVDFYPDGPSCVSLVNEHGYYAKPAQIV